MILLCRKFVTKCISLITFMPLSIIAPSLYSLYLTRTPYAYNIRSMISTESFR